MQASGLRHAHLVRDTGRLSQGSALVLLGDGLGGADLAVGAQPGGAPLVAEETGGELRLLAPRAYLHDHNIPALIDRSALLAVFEAAMSATEGFT